MTNIIKKRVGLMGGTFNPIHLGHLLLAETAREAFHLESILFVPSGRPYMKDKYMIASKEHRVQMTALAIADNPNFQLSLIEVEKEGNSYTYETLAALQSQNKDTAFFFIIGADCLFAIETWRYPEQIFENCTLLAAVRDNRNTIELEAQIKYLCEKYKASIFLLPMKELDISSTDIRTKIQVGHSVRYMVPQKVIAYLEKHHLYYRGCTFMEDEKANEAKIGR